MLNTFFPRIVSLVPKKMAEVEEDSPLDCSLHQCIFDDDYRRLSQLIRTHDVAQKDKHGKYTVIENITSLNEFARISEM